MNEHNISYQIMEKGIVVVVFAQKLCIESYGSA